MRGKLARFGHPRKITISGAESVKNPKPKGTSLCQGPAAECVAHKILRPKEGNALLSLLLLSIIDDVLGSLG